MTRTIVTLAALAFSASAAAAPCAYEGSVPSYVMCIADQAWTALELAENTAARVSGVCPDGFESVGTSCIDITCRGPGEVEDADIDTYGAAEDRCAERGARLCSMSELIDSRTSGCDFDVEYLAVQMAQPGDERVFRRGRMFDGDGSCPGDTYTGNFYEDAYYEVGACETHHIYMDGDDHIDGFLCCL